MVRVEDKEIKNYRDLIAWQKAMLLVTLIYEVTKNFPKEEIYGIVNQMRRAAVSIPSNIAEGSSRRSTQEFIRYINIARGSLSELETQLTVSKNLQYISLEQEEAMLQNTNEISRILQGLYASLNSRL